MGGGGAFAALHRNGHWGQVTGFPDLLHADEAPPNSVACTPAGKCVAGGLEFVVDENQGTWGQPQSVTVGS